MNKTPLFAIIAIYPQIKEFYALGKNIIDKISNGIFAKESFDIIERKIIICNRDSCLFLLMDSSMMR